MSAASNHKSKSKLEDLLAIHFANDGFEPVREYKIGPRGHRFDFAFPDVRVAVEVEGGTWTGGRHSRGVGFASDCAKYNFAVLSGWRVLRFTGDMVKDGTARRITAAAVDALRGFGHAK
jgi:very-short-patch-repair endonuclease